MGKTVFTNAHDLLAALARIMNIINPAVESHHERVAYLSFQMATELGMCNREGLQCVVAALLHDVGALFAEEQPQDLSFELHAHHLAAAGAEMMEDLPYFDEVARIVASCQRPWRLSRPVGSDPEEAPLTSSIVRLADHASICIGESAALNQREKILALFAKRDRDEYAPEVTDAFQRVCERDAVWMDLVYDPHVLLDLIAPIPLSLARTSELCCLVSRLIDYRSSFTAMHSAGVSASAVRLAELVGMSDDECQMMEIAGLLHDLGKVRTPKAILEAPRKLTDQEFNIIKEHAYFTHQILSRIEGFESICEWASLHHERLDGGGYPFRLSGRQLPLGARIMAVADIFSAVTEERPYRKGMDRERTIAVMRDNVERGALSPRIVELLLDNFDDVNERRDIASRIEGARYFQALERSRTA